MIVALKPAHQEKNHDQFFKLLPISIGLIRLWQDNPGDEEVTEITLAGLRERIDILPLASLAR
ncbi:MAG: hypothetical protein BroJett011_17960 [Chloroflexota bacterium]|nr:MAG: hypothetical protein BroJett011_17960 [Chloroflexota bacterium]